MMLLMVGSQKDGCWLWAVWRVCMTVFPGIKIQGFIFHWCQVIRKKIVELGLLKTLNNRPCVSISQENMALPFLPKGQIPGAFLSWKVWQLTAHLKTSCPMLRDSGLCVTYSDQRGGATSWKMYEQIMPWKIGIRDSSAKRGQFQLYLVIELLHKEGSHVTVQTKPPLRVKSKDIRQRDAEKSRQEWWNCGGNIIDKSSLNTLLGCCSYLSYFCILAFCNIHRYDSITAAYTL